MHRSRPALVLAARALAAATAVAVGVGSGVASRAGGEPTSDAAASTDPAGAHVELGAHESWVEVRPRTGGTTTGCRRRWIPSGEFQLRPTPAGDYRQVPLTEPRPGPEYTPYQVWCDADYLGTVWLRPQQFGVDPRDLAVRLVRDLPYPTASVGAVPATRGLTGLDSWFWVTGYDGAPIHDTVRAFGLSVDVEATVGSVSWDFGDGTTANGLGLGNPPPGPATVSHRYEHRSRPAFTVRNLLTLTVRWRLNGGGWQPLDPVVRTATRSYPVVESRAALVPDA
ncbi:MAG: hypothetical protein ABJC79_07215 [Acidimicrobiia bacterium]